MKQYAIHAAVVLAAALVTAHAEQPDATMRSTTVSEPGKATAMDTVDVTAKVLKVDMPTRTVTVLGPLGGEIDVVAGDEVKNLAQIKAGDMVALRYVESLALELKKGSGIRERVERETAAQAKPGEKPGAAAGKTIQFVADVVRVDAKKRYITLKGAKGRLVDLKVKNPEQFKLIKVGDQIEGTFTQAVAISVDPAKPKK